MRKIVYILILTILFAVMLFLLPDFLNIYYQVKGGNILSYLTGYPGNENAQGFACSSPYTGNNLDRDLVSKVIGYYQRALAYDEDDSHSNLQLGRIYCYVNDPQSAIKHYNRFIELRPNNPLGYLELGFAYEQLLKACENNPECKLSTYYLEAVLSAWEKIDVRVENFLQAGDEQRKLSEISTAHAWYLRGLLLGGEKSLDASQKNDNFLIIEEFATLTFWKPCEWCENVDGNFEISNGVLLMSDRNNLKERDDFGYRMLQRIPLEDNKNLVLRVQGEPGTLLTVEAVIDNDRVRLISYHPVPDSWDIVSAPIEGDIFSEITIFIREPQPLYDHEEYILNIDWIGISK